MTGMDVNLLSSSTIHLRVMGQDAELIQKLFHYQRHRGEELLKGIPSHLLKRLSQQWDMSS